MWLLPVIVRSFHAELQVIWFIPNASEIERGNIPTPVQWIPQCCDVRTAVTCDLIGRHRFHQFGKGLSLGRCGSCTMSRTNRKIAVIHDFLYCYAGAERVLEQILNIYPEADLFSLFDFLKPEDRGFIHNKSVTATFIQRMPFAKRFHRAYLPLMPLAIEQLDLSGYDVVISSSYLAAKGVITRPDQLHICYCHTPVRFAWDMQRQYLTQSGLMRGLKSFAAKVLLHYIRGWDSRSSNGVDVFLTNSRFVSRRIQKVYRRQATPLYPPVDVENFQPSRGPRSGFVTASRLVPYKRIDLIVEAFKRMPDKQLTVIGDGPQFKQLKAMAGPNVNLMGYQPFDVLRQQMQSAEAFVF